MLHYIWIWLSLSTLLLAGAAPPAALKQSLEEADASFWQQQAQQQLAQRLKRTSGLKDSRVAKNIIFLLGDGMSIATLTTARILKGQRQGRSGEESQLAVEDFPHAGLCKTYCVDRQTPDSACTATAYLSGVKTNYGTIGQSARGERVDSIAKWAQRAGKATGIVTTTRLTDASPAGNYAHVHSRRYPRIIAEQLINELPGREFKVLLGGGLSNISNENAELLERLRRPDDCFARTSSELQRCRRAFNATGGSARLLGVFQEGHFKYHMEAEEEQPRLSEMVQAAIERLAQQPQGYFLFVEGGLIDHGHHATRAVRALDETLEFDAAIETAMRLTNDQETLIVVTADHSHAFAMAGYAKRGTDILGMDDMLTKDANGVPYSTLNYVVGKWQSMKNGTRVNPAPCLKSITPSYINRTRGVHAGEDVAVFANGPQAHLFGGVMEQNLLPHLMGYAGCLGNGTIVCKN